MALTWTLAEIRAKVRLITGEKTEEDISNDDLDSQINDFYQNDFPRAAHVADFDGWYELAMASDDGGEYTVELDYLKLMTPMTILDSDDILTTVKFFQDKDEFFHLYPQDPDATEDRPAAVLLYGGVLYAGPKANANYTFKAACTKKPDALTADTAPVDLNWGKAIAYGTAIEMKMEDQDEDAANGFVPLYQYFLNKLSQKEIMQKATNQRATPRF